MDSVAVRLCLVIHCLFQQVHYGSTQCQQGRASAHLYLWTKTIHQGQCISTCLVKLPDKPDRHHDIFAVVRRSHEAWVAKRN